MTKSEVVANHKEMWIDAVQRGYISRTDKIAFNESWNNYTDSLCKEGSISDHQYNTWSTPPMPKRIPKA